MLTLDDALDAGPPVPAPRDPHGTWVTGTYQLGPTRPCRWCGRTTRQAWWRGARVELLLDVEHVADPAGVNPHWLAWWWNDRRPLQDRIARHDGEHLARGDLLFVMHPCADPVHRPATTCPATAPPPARPDREAPPVMTTFGTPAPPGEGVKNDELVGHLLLITVLEKKTGLVTSNGPADVVVADVVELDTGREHPGNFLFGRVLFGQLSVGVTYLGRIEKGVQQPGKSAPWVFNSAHEDAAAVQTAQQYIAYKATQTPTPAAAPAPAPTAPPAPAFPPQQAAPAAAPVAAGAPPWAQ